jgi:Hypothetical protein (DUF2513)
MDLVREILLRVNADPSLNGLRFVVFSPTDFPGHTQDEIAYHVDLLFEAGFVKGLENIGCTCARNF